SFAVSLALLFVPPGLLPISASATWPLRDVIDLFGVLLGGSSLTLFLRRRRAIAGRLIVAQTVIIAVGAIPLIGGGGLLLSRGIFPVGTYNALIESRTPYIRALEAAIGAHSVLGGRFIATSRASQMMDQEMLVDVGAVNNIAVN